MLTQTEVSELYSSWKHWK